MLPGVFEGAMIGESARMVDAEGESKMSEFPIQSGRHKGKAVNAPYYLKTNHGVELKLVHNIPATSGRSIRWVQTVDENGEIYRRCGRATYVDPLNPTGKKDKLTGREICKPGDNKPFYYTDKEHASRGTSFYDAPQERAPKNGRLKVRFTTSLVEVDKTRIEILATLYWGYDRTAWRIGQPKGGRILMAKLRRASAEEVKKHMEILKKDFPGWAYHCTS